MSLEESIAHLNLNTTTNTSVYSLLLEQQQESLGSNDVLDNLERATKQQQQHFGRPPVEQNSTSVVEQPATTTTTTTTTTTITLKEVATKVNHTWTNRILFVQTIRNPVKLSTGLFTLVRQEDKEPLVSIPLSLWNYLPLKGNDELLFAASSRSDLLHSELPMDSYLALLHPLTVPTNTYLGNDNNNKASVMIRCDNPDCIRIFNSKEEWEHAKTMEKSFTATIHSPPAYNKNNKSPTTAMEWKDQGNDAFVKKKDITLAMRYYKIALAIATSSASSSSSSSLQTDVAISCLGNLAETCLQSHKYEEAERHARRILNEYDPNQFKAQFRLARSLIPQSNNETTEEAQAILMQLRKDFPKHASSLQPLLGECLQAIMEGKGKFNLKKMLGEESLSPVLTSFHANYVSPLVDLGVTVVRPSDGETYRGVAAKDDIPEGTLLTASKAFAFAYQQRSNYNNHGRSSSSSSSSSAVRKQHLYEVSQVHQAVQTLQNCPSQAASFYQLEAGGEAPDDVTKTSPDIDLIKIRSILESNRFGVDISNPASPFTLKSPSSEGGGEGDDEVGYVGVGLWLDVSMYNHSCTPNCTWAQIGNHMFVYACKTVKKGDELCIAYVHPAFSYQDRVERFAKWSGGKGFVCGCEWCHWMRTSPKQFQEMNEEVKRAQMRMGSGEAFSSIDELISVDRRAEIRAAHRDVPLRFQHTVYNVCMMEALQAANAADRHGARDAVKAATELGYAIRGGLRQETRVQDLCCLAAAHFSCDEDKAAQAALAELVKHQVILRSLTEFQNVILMSSMQIWNTYQSEPFMKRFPVVIKQVWQQRSRKLK